MECSCCRQNCPKFGLFVIAGITMLLAYLAYKENTHQES